MKVAAVSEKRGEGGTGLSVDNSLVVSLWLVASLLALSYSDEISSLHYQHKNLQQLVEIIQRKCMTIM